MSDSGEGKEKRRRGPTRPLNQRLAEIKRKVDRIEKSQSRVGQKAFARARILVGLAALEQAATDPAFAATLAGALRSFTKTDRDRASVAELLDDLDRSAAACSDTTPALQQERTATVATARLTGIYCMAEGNGR